MRLLQQIWRVARKSMARVPVISTYRVLACCWILSPRLLLMCMRNGPQVRRQEHLLTAEAAVSICSANERRSRLLVYPSAKEDSRSARYSLEEAGRCRCGGRQAAADQLSQLFSPLALGFTLYWLIWSLALASRFALALLWQAPECPPPIPHARPSDPRCPCPLLAATPSTTPSKTPSATPASTKKAPRRNSVRLGSG
jgi:hypothetical protein